MSNPTVASVSQRLVDTMVDGSYAEFHHNQTTRRDGGGFHGQW
jgi:hypothetical protein